MRPLSSTPAKVIATISGLTLGAFAVFQYARLVGGEPLVWLHISPGPPANTTRVVFGVATLLVAFMSFQRACRKIGALTAAAWTGVGSGLFLVVAWVATQEFARPPYASDTRDALQILAAPFAITSLLALFAGQVLALLRYSPLQPVQRSNRSLIAGSASLALTSILIGLGPFRLQLGEWHYVLALWAGDAACVGFLAVARTESFVMPETRSVLIRWATGLNGIGMMLVAVMM
jgi:hypothetical protein